MITDVSQRWHGGRASYRPKGEPIDTSRYEVAAIDGKGADNIARNFIEREHYSASMPAARERFGLYRGGALVGCVVFSHPAQDAVLACLPCPKDEAVELGRLVLLEDVPANGESWFVARTFEVMRARGYTGVVSFADPIARSSIDGEQVKPGHVGLIYQASNAIYAGIATARTLRLLPDGRVFSERARSKIRKRETGWQYAVEQLVAAGAEPPEQADAASLAAWLKSALDKVTRKLKHGGNHRYLFPLTPQVRRHIYGPFLPYPKLHSGPSMVVKPACLWPATLSSATASRTPRTGPISTR